LEQQQVLFDYILRIADNALILGHRISERCGHGPSLETDIGMTNVALDLVGHANMLLEYAAEVENKGRTADDLAFLRDTREFKNALLVEQENGHFGDIIVRQFIFDTFNYYFFEALCESADEQLVSIAKKAIKEVSYHFKYSAEWVIRLGDGTEESHGKVQEALNELWAFSGELYTSDSLDKDAVKHGFGVDLDAIKVKADKRIEYILKEATLTLPEEGWMHRGGKQGKHSEDLGRLLAEMQWMQRAYPGMNW